MTHHVIRIERIEPWAAAEEIAQQLMRGDNTSHYTTSDNSKFT